MGGLNNLPPPPPLPFSISISRQQLANPPQILGLQIPIQHRRPPGHEARVRVRAEERGEAVEEVEGEVCAESVWAAARGEDITGAFVCCRAVESGYWGVDGGDDGPGGGGEEGAGEGVVCLGVGWWDGVGRVGLVRGVFGLLLGWGGWMLVEIDVKKSEYRSRVPRKRMMPAVSIVEMMSLFDQKYSWRYFSWIT